MLLLYLLLIKRLYNWFSYYSYYNIYKDYIRKATLNVFVNKLIYIFYSYQTATIFKYIFNQGFCDGIREEIHGMDEWYRPF